MKKEAIVLKGQEYAAPRAESIEVVNQGVLCASGGDSGDFEIKEVESDFLS